MSADVLGRTETGEPEGTWIRTSAQAVRDLIEVIGITNYDNTSFNQVSIINNQLVSITIPSSPSGGLTTVKSVVDNLNRSTHSALTLDNDLALKYESMIVRAPDNIHIIRDSDVVRWSLQTTNGNTIASSVVKYRFKDVERPSLESGNNVISFTSDFVENYVNTSKSEEFDLYLYEECDAKVMGHRLVYYRRLGRTDVKVSTDLRLENIEIGDVVQLEFDRLYKRFGDEETRKKLLTVVGKTVTGEKIDLDLTDYGNTFNSSSIITENDAPNYTSADSDDKLRDGYITQNNGITNDEEQTSNINRIS